jgi:arylsulfatase A-like enzyme
MTPTMRALVGLVVCAGLVASLALTEETRPNFVLLISDDASWAHYGFMEHPEASADTPHLDTLANQGMQFDVLHLTATMCRPSAAGIVTGRYCRDVQTIGGKKLDWDNQALIPKRLRDAGYDTFLGGKFTLHDSPLTQYGFTHLDEFGEAHRNRFGITHDPSSLYEFIEAHKQKPNEPKPKPFFVWYFVHTPHRPWNAPEEFNIDNPDPKLERYLPMMSWLDSMVEGLLDALGDDPDTGLIQNTMILYLTDNGGFLKQSKGRFTENGFRTPLLVSYPAAGWTPRRYRDGSELVHAVDLLPTILDYAGAWDPDDPELQLLEGRSLRPLLEGNLQGWDRNYLFGHVCHSSGAGGNERYLRTKDGLMFTMNKRGKQALFNVGGNRLEPTKENLADYPVEAKEWCRALSEWWCRDDAACLALCP